MPRYESDHRHFAELGIRLGLEPPYRPMDPAALSSEPDFLLPLPSGDGKALSMRFRRIPRGEFIMGSRGESEDEEPRHRVVIEREFWLGKFVVTQEEYAAVVRGLLRLQRPHPDLLDPDPSFFKGLRRPVEQVSWDDATAWCAALGEWVRKMTDVREVRLPKEAEWEYACRAGSETDYYNGDGEAALAEVGWYGANSSGEFQVVDQPVGSGPQGHPAGLIGMHGNVWEWCRDVFDAVAYRKREDPWSVREWTLGDAGADATHRFVAIKPGEVPDRVLRGGPGFGEAGWCRSAFRAVGGPSDRGAGCGFRVCLVRGPVSKGKGRETDQRARAPVAPEVGGGGTTAEAPGAAGAGAAGVESIIDLTRESFSCEAGSRDRLKPPTDS